MGGRFCPLLEVWQFHLGAATTSTADDVVVVLVAAASTVDEFSVRCL
jgi:hypothetical protein